MIVRARGLPVRRAPDARGTRGLTAGWKGGLAEAVCWTAESAGIARPAATATGGPVDAARSTLGRGPRPAMKVSAQTTVTAKSAYATPPKIR
mgnify:CR=1 FL=1